MLWMRGTVVSLMILYDMGYYDMILQHEHSELKRQSRSDADNEQQKNRVPAASLVEQACSSGHQSLHAALPNVTNPRHSSDSVIGCPASVRQKVDQWLTSSVLGHKSATATSNDEGNC